MCRVNLVAILLSLISSFGCQAVEQAGEPLVEPNEQQPRASEPLSPHIDIPATEVQARFDFAIDIHGRGEARGGRARVGDVRVRSNLGTVEVNGRVLRTVAWEFQPWPEVGHDVVTMLAVDGHAWYLLFLYCRDGALEYTWLEGTDGTELDWQPARGTCRMEDREVRATLTLPASSIQVPIRERATQVRGERIELVNGQQGWVALGGRRLLAFPFQEAVVDLEDGTHWRELHTLMWEPSAQRACLGIFYFYDEHPALVIASYGFSLPDMLPPFRGYQEFAASWW